MCQSSCDVKSSMSVSDNMNRWRTTVTTVQEKGSHSWLLPMSANSVWRYARCMWIRGQQQQLTLSSVYVCHKWNTVLCSLCKLLLFFKKEVSHQTDDVETSLRWLFCVLAYCYCFSRLIRRSVQSTDANPIAQSSLKVVKVDRKNMSLPATHSQLLYGKSPPPTFHE